MGDVLVLRDVARHIRGLADTIVEAQDGEVVTPSETLLRCFGDWQVGFGHGDRLTFTPASASAHAAGRVYRSSPAGTLRSICLAHGRRLVLPARFAGAYKAVIAGDAIAVSLTFGGRPCPAYEERGQIEDIAAIVLAREEVTFLYGAKTARFRVES